MVMSRFGWLLLVCAGGLVAATSGVFAGARFEEIRSFGFPEVSGVAGTQVIEGSDGVLYGGARGGSNSAGFVFRVNKDGTGYAVVHSFSYEDGSPGTPGLLEASDGMLYGVADDRNIFRLNKDGSGYSVVHRFTSQIYGDLHSLAGGFIEASDGFFYGGATGGPGELGVIFRMAKDGTELSVVRQGIGVLGKLLEADDGVLYGATASHLFKISRDGLVFSFL